MSGNRDSKSIRERSRWSAARWLALAVALSFLALRPAFAGYSSIVVDDSTGDVLHEMNADVVNYPASLTKVMTLYIAFGELQAGRLKLDQTVTVSKHASLQAPSKLGLQPGDKITVEQLILAMVTKSANDAAVALAEAMGGNESAFAKRMTATAHKLGMTATDFENASGLPDPDQVTTARDMAVLARAVIHRYPQYYHYFSTSRFKYEGRVYRNHNRLLKTYAGVDGMKTGYIRAAGFNLIASAERGGRRLIAVVLGSQSPSARNAQMTRLLNTSFLKQATRLAAADGKPDSATASTKAPAVSVAAAARPAHAKPAGRDKSWGIQVGAFSRFGPAHLAAHRAVRNAPRLLSHSHVAVDTTTDDGAAIYRARLMGLSQIRARKACAVLVAKNMECLTVASDGTIATVSTEQGDSDAR